MESSSVWEVYSISRASKSLISCHTEYTACSAYIKYQYTVYSETHQSTVPLSLIQVRQGIDAGGQDQAHGNEQRLQLNGDGQSQHPRWLQHPPPVLLSGRQCPSESGQLHQQHLPRLGGPGVPPGRASRAMRVSGRGTLLCKQMGQGNLIV